MTKAYVGNVTKCLLEQVILRFGLPEVIDSDRGFQFTGKMTQGIIKQLIKPLGICLLLGGWRE